MPFSKPFSEACARNQQPIAAILETCLSRPCRVLEIGSGTGQHAVFMARLMPHLQWQPTDLAEAIPAIELWRKDANLPNLAAPLELDVNQSPWPVDSTAKGTKREKNDAEESGYDAVFTANTVHFVGWSTVENLFRGAAEVLKEGGQLLVYGPFNENGSYTSTGNAQLDSWLKARDPDSGIKDRSAVIALAAGYGLEHEHTNALPANNELLAFRKI
ncbi:MAG: methylase [Alteromonadaceae bacterium]|nr:methylase [Alteromonadaceae bacterium]